jgi:fused signal recognition particle receptor
MSEVLEVQTEEVSLDLRVSNAFNVELSKLRISEDELRTDAEKAMTITIDGIADKEGWKQADEARKNLKVKRVTITKVAKFLREESTRYSKKVISREEELIGLIDEAENHLEKQQKDIQAKKDAIKKAEEERIAAAYALRIAELTKLGVTFNGISFTIGEVTFDANDIKKASEELYQQAILTPCKEAYEKVEAERIAENARLEQERQALEAAKAESDRVRMEAEAQLAEQRAEMERQQAEFRIQQEEFEAKRREAEKVEEEKRNQERLAAQAEAEKVRQAEWEKQKAIEIEEQSRIAAEKAATQERERIEAEQRAAELKKQQEEARKAEELAMASDKTKWESFISAISAVKVPEMRSGQYRKRAMIAKEKLEEIIG